MHSRFDRLGPPVLLILGVVVCLAGIFDDVFDSYTDAERAVWAGGIFIAAALGLRLIVKLKGRE